MADLQLREATFSISVPGPSFLVDTPEGLAPYPELTLEVRRRYGDERIDELETS